MTERLLVSCEHAGHRVPRWLRPYFAGADAVLTSHRGWDPGAYPVARHLALAWGAPLFATTTSRLVVEPNRSLGHRRLFSEYTRGLDAADRQRLLDEHYHAHREPIIARCAGWAAAGDRVLHLGIHSFTPVFDGEVRAVDLALLYDPARPDERELVDAWLARIAARDPALRLRRNHPYRGDADGLTTSLRRQLPAERYLGIEVEMNQTLTTNRAGRSRLAAVLAATLEPARAAA